MLRRLDVKTQSLVCLLVGGAIACGSAPPVDIGTDRVAPALVSTPEGDVALDEGAAEPGQMPLGDEFTELLGRRSDRGTISEHCRSSFRACGGVLAGTWRVEDTCNPEVNTREILQKWGTTRMALDEAACANAVQRLTWTWSGELRFSEGFAFDGRKREQNVDIQLTASCLGATLGMDLGDSVSPEICDSMQSESTTCALANGVCMCASHTLADGAASGVYGVLGLSVAIAAEPTTRYEFCVDGDHLLWQEKEGALRQVVLVRTEDAAPGETDPVDLPSEVPR